jgi:hypothetical protein
VHRFNSCRGHCIRVRGKRSRGRLKISPAEVDEVAAELARTLDHFGAPEREKGELLAAFAAHKDEVTEGYSQ